MGQKHNRSKALTREKFKSVIIYLLLYFKLIKLRLHEEILRLWKTRAIYSFWKCKSYVEHITASQHLCKEMCEKSAPLLKQLLRRAFWSPRWRSASWPSASNPSLITLLSQGFCWKTCRRSGSVIPCVFRESYGIWQHFHGIV